MLLQRLDDRDDAADVVDRRAAQIRDINKDRQHRNRRSGGISHDNAGRGICISYVCDTHRDRRRSHLLYSRRRYKA